MDRSSVAIYQSPFPNQMASDEEKSSEKYGLKVAKSIEGAIPAYEGNGSAAPLARQGRRFGTCSVSARVWPKT